MEGLPPSSNISGFGSEFVRGSVDVPGATVSYLARGRQGAPLVLIPGSFNDSRALKAIVDGLEVERRVVLIELRGHGESWPPPIDGSIEQFAEDALAIADHLSLTDLFIGGHSIGGMVALELARVHSQLVSGVISIEGWTNHHAQHDAFQGDTMSTLSAEQLAEREQLRQAVLHCWTDEQKTDFTAIWRTWDGYSFLQQTDIPILEIYGDRGRELPGLDQLHIPLRGNIEVRWIAGASHSLPLEQPGEVAELITGFMARVQDGSG